MRTTCAKTNSRVLRDTAISAAQAAGYELMRHFRTKLRISQKRNDGLVTDADLAAERAAIKVLKSALPDFGIIAEESAPEKVKNLRHRGYWILDPLDGTTNFAHGSPVFCVSIAAEWDGKIVAGIVYHPISGETYSAMRGLGAFVGKRRMRVSTTKHLKDAYLSTGFSSNKEKWFSQEIVIFERLSRAANAVRRPGSAALDLANVARGVFDGFWERGLKPWDVAAGKLLVEEAGGKVTTLSGNGLALDAGEVLASNGILHRSLCREISPAVLDGAPSNVGASHSRQVSSKKYYDPITHRINASN